ncbi:hypothetical protein SGB_00522 [Shigella boydii ATCC 9905]|nr:hypothetical protein SGB_00522 [Shigella boydii ATCC 9905]
MGIPQTAWGGDVHSTVQGVSAERAWRDPAEMIVIRLCPLII